MPERPNTAKEYAGSLQKWCFLGMLWLFFCIPVLKAQENASLEKVVIGDNRFILHTVQKSETLYSIAKTYDCTQEEVLGANKNITGIIKKGMILKIPDHTYQKPQLSKVDENRFFRHQVVSGDNYYQLKLRYDVEEEELLKYNPALKEGLKAGMILLIPKKNGQAETPAATPVRTEKAPEVAAVPSPAKPKNMGQPLNIGVYLPLSANVTDSTKLSAKTLSFLSFYQGMLMAADQLSQSGIKTRLYVYDTEKPGSAPGNLAKKPEFANLDLIIGPVYPEAQGAVAEAANLHHLPMVSPLSPDDQWTRKFPLYFQLNPVRKARINATADYIWKEFSQEKVWLLEMEGKSQETREIHSLLEKKGARTGHNGNLAS
ncbi:MAG: LysM peptidoglycan-binding domain-containing protein, partial [Marinilabiliales bacterium]|nr:LysM peptidoglycan-binding domain-containing protein [Marinilabiliales bacterium]